MPYGEVRELPRGARSCSLGSSATTDAGKIPRAIHRSNQRDLNAKLTSQRPKPRRSILSPPGLWVQSCRRTFSSELLIRIGMKAKLPPSGIWNLQWTAGTTSEDRHLQRAGAGRHFSVSRSVPLWPLTAVCDEACWASLNFYEIRAFRITSTRAAWQFDVSMWIPE
jgi:hypothetical protein